MKGAPACSRHLDGCVAQLEANSLPSSPKGREFQLVSIFTNHQFAASRTTARAHSFSVTLFQNQLHLSGLPEQTDGIWNRSGGQTRVQPILTLLLAALPSPVSKCHRRVPWEPSAVQHVRPDISGTAPPLQQTRGPERPACMWRIRRSSSSLLLSTLGRWCLHGCVSSALMRRRAGGGGPVNPAHRLTRLHPSGAADSQLFLLL